MLPKNHQKKKQTKNLSDVSIGQMKIAVNTQMHAEFKWRYQNAELKKGLTSKTFQNLWKCWDFRIGTKKQKKGRLFHLVKNTDADYPRNNDQYTK